jgi:hypothetical protein
MGCIFLFSKKNVQAILNERILDLKLFLFLKKSFHTYIYIGVKRQNTKQLIINDLGRKCGGKDFFVGKESLFNFAAIKKSFKICCSCKNGISRSIFKQN